MKQVQVKQIQNTLDNYKKILETSQGYKILLKDDVFLNYLVLLLDNFDESIVNESLQILINISNTQYGYKLKRLSNLAKVLIYLDSKYTSIILKDKLKTLQTHLNSIEVEDSSIIKQIDGVSKMFEFFIEGLSQETIKLCQNCLIKIKGILSFTFNSSKSTCIIRTTKLFDPHLIIKALKQINISANLLVLNEHGEKVPLTIDDDYIINDVVQPVKDGHPKISPDTIDNSQTLCKTNESANQSQGLFGNKASGWFKSAKAYINESFYW